MVVVHAKVPSHNSFLSVSSEVYLMCVTLQRNCQARHLTGLAVLMRLLSTLSHKSYTQDASCFQGDFCILALCTLVSIHVPIYSQSDALFFMKLCSIGESRGHSDWQLLKSVSFTSGGTLPHSRKKVILIAEQWTEYCFHAPHHCRGTEVQHRWCRNSCQRRSLNLARCLRLKHANVYFVVLSYSAW